MAAHKFKTQRVFEQPAALAGATFHQIFVLDLGREEPTILITNDRHTTHAKLITRYAQRMLIANALADRTPDEAYFTQQTLKNAA